MHHHLTVKEAGFGLRFKLTSQWRAFQLKITNEFFHSNWAWQINQRKIRKSLSWDYNSSLPTWKVFDLGQSRIIKEENHPKYCRSFGTRVESNGLNKQTSTKHQFRGSWSKRYRFVRFRWKFVVTSNSHMWAFFVRRN